MRVNKSVHIYLAVGLLTLFFSVNSLAQNENEANKTIILGEEFNVGWLHKSLFGSQWRDLWTTPISIPIFIALPEDEALNKFSGQVGFLESCNNPYDVKEINKITELFNSIENENNTKVDSKEFLKIRLMNILLGNWDRNINKWKWDKIENQNIYNLEPHPNNSDQALAKFGGLLPYSVSFIFPELTSFNDNLAHAGNYTQSGSYIDRRFLTELTKSQWDSITVYIQLSITDVVIVSAVNKIPSGIKPEVKDEIINTIKNRRDKLSELCDDYYSIINKVVDIYGSNNNDSVTVNRISNDITSVELY